MNTKIIILLFLSLFSFTIESTLSNGKEGWGYVNVRKDAHMFYWLYYANGGVDPNPESMPLVIWLQGGPGASGTGFGNFQEIGPLDVDLKPRNTSWIKYANLLFIDNPVGTGFSYVDNDNALAQNNTQIAIDLVTFMKQFYSKYPQFTDTPLYIFCESYGGKMTATFAKHLYNEIKSGGIKSNFKGVALGDSWISPIDSVATWGLYLHSTSLLDDNELMECNALVNQIRDALNSGQYSYATQLWSSFESSIEQYTGGVNFYNILQNQPDDSSFSKFSKHLLSNSINKLKNLHRYLGPFNQNNLYDLMNGPMRKKFGIIPSNVTWSGQSGDVFSALQSDFMLPVVNDVDYLLSNTTLKVVVYTGQLDLIVDTVGTLNWINRLQWSGLKQWQTTQKIVFTDQTGYPEAFAKSFKNFSLYWILKAGHMVPSDAADTALMMLKRVLSN